MAGRAVRAAPTDDGTVRINGIVLPADMSDELKTLNVKIEDTSYEKSTDYEECFLITRVPR
ncbi:hypothetical protein ANCDUO_06307 [Ancylostoma duodenale]|uniref:Uncharacterized protein n=1 Tax=Ancylostoma duodenale TaxID=51022 RepID=A0A0C2D211_9BILA|nr:hypothetical protein ANCDUO_06307 [Ancylostoma duodenale]